MSLFVSLMLVFFSGAVFAGPAITTDLSITKTDGAASAVPGATGHTYTIVVTNAGPDDTTASATVADTFPAALQSCTWTCSASAGSACSASGSGTINDTGVDLLDGGTATYTATCTIDSSATGTLSNTAAVAAVDNDPTAGNNAATDTTTLNPTADLSITKTDGVTSAVAGGSVTYTIVASNAGPSDDPSASVVDTFPSDLSCTYTSIVAGGASGNTTSGSGNLSETLALPSGSSVAYNVICAIDGLATGTLSNTATITASVTDPTPGNNSATDDDTVLSPAPIADLSVTIVGTASPDSIAYTIVASNTGSLDDPNASVSSVFAAGLSCIYTSAVAGGATGNTDGSGNLNETLSLPAGASVTYSVGCLVDSGATAPFSSSVAISGSVPDSNPGNGSGTSVINQLPPGAPELEPGPLAVPALSSIGLLMLSLLLVGVVFVMRGKVNRI